MSFSISVVTSCLHIILYSRSASHWFCQGVAHDISQHWISFPTFPPSCRDCPGRVLEGPPALLPTMMCPIFLSSANLSKTFTFSMTYSSRSFLKIVKRMGPRNKNAALETPDVTLTHPEALPLRTTLCLLFFSQSPIQSGWKMLYLKT